ncbi:probable threonine protease PRSS50 [Ochotona princeps]|uniref:probable threonine protease PRSS50 n=1 Tax=Ochotona princeps TaxID=9978 RepID=UPI002714874E|nr:probable threonine protease PRSS50 [Ochotona princeps]
MEAWIAAPRRASTRAPLLLPLLLLLLLLLWRPPGCSGTLDASEAPAVTISAIQDKPSVTCTLSTSCLSDSPPVRQLGTQTSPETTVQVLPSCGISKERDPTLRDPEAMARRWPWMVSVRANGSHICAGTLISSRWVLTVAHCLIKKDVHYTVQMGAPWLNREADTISEVAVTQVIVNSRFRAQRYWSWIGRANDIGLLKLQRAFVYSKYIWPVCLPGTDFAVKEQRVCTVTGWGLSRANSTWPQYQTIQEKEVTIMSTKECETFYHRFSRMPRVVRIVNPQMLCAEDKDREEFCYEESGEPLTCLSGGTWYLLGMVSWGAGCKSEAPPIYLQVSSYHQWIWDIINNQQPGSPPAPSRALLLALLLPLSLLPALCH